jgi:chitodextrinase
MRVQHRQSLKASTAVLLTLFGSSTVWAGGRRDRTPPTTPTHLQVTAVSPTSVSLSWSPSTDNSGSFFYVLYANNVVVANASMTATTLTHTGLNPSTTYTFRLRARDQALNWSGFSNAVTATTLSNNTPPAPPVLSASVGPTHIRLTWNAPANGAPPFRYWIYRDGVLLITWHQTNSITFYGLTPGTTHTYTVQVRTGTGVFSAHSNAVTPTTPPADPNDHTPPTAPTNLSVNSWGDAEFSLDWTQSTDNVTPQAFIRYDVYVDGVPSDVKFGSGFNSINYGTQGQNNTVQVIATDEAGNASAPATLTFFLP